MRSPRPSGRFVVLLCAVTVGIVCALSSPVVMLAMDRWAQVDWTRLSDIGQAYGLASAIFSALAVIGVAASLAYQSRSLVVQRNQTISDAHSRLLLLVLSEPETYGPMFGDRSQRMGSIEYKRYIFVTLALRMALSNYETGHSSDYALRNEVFRGLFQRSIGRDHWRESRRFWLSSSVPAHRRFARIADEEYRAALARGPALPIPPERVTRPLLPRAALAAVVCGGLLGAAVMAARRCAPRPGA